jgi:hypothetical protein
VLTEDPLGSLEKSAKDHMERKVGDLPKMVFPALMREGIDQGDNERPLTKAFW